MLEETPQYGYDQLKKVAAFGVAFGCSFSAAVHAASPIAKAAAFLTCLDEAADLLALEMAQAKRELDDMDDDEWYALTHELADEFALECDDDALDDKISKSVDLAFTVLRAMREGVAIWSEAK